ncbi:MAG: ATP-binding cassette domain-containing protein [Clostridiales bacterium]|jgi:ABC-type multidrug transport system ATPase subunit|nr:ATP-binding cassette domain-containing protein [Clostridiales bacterium]
MYDNQTLTVVVGALKPVEVELAEFETETISFGRADTNAIVLRSEIASLFHGFLSLASTPSGERVIVNDRDSTNGIYVNGARVEGKRMLKDGDTITFESPEARVLSQHVRAVVMVLNYRPQNASAIWSSMLLPEKEISIGRSHKCDITLDYSEVLRHHASIYTSDDTSWLLPKHGKVYINGKRIDGRVKLCERDVIFLGEAKLVYVKGTLYYNKQRPTFAVHVRKANFSVGGKGDKKKILDNVSFSVFPCEFVAIIGGSGAGKSTLLNGMCGFSFFTDGDVYYGDDSLYEHYQSLRDLIGYVPQRDIVYDTLTLRDMLMYTAELRMADDASAEERTLRVEQVLQTMELGDRAQTLIKNLSGGQRKRASVAVELIADPAILFLDEPTSGLDPGTERKFMQTLKGMTLQNKTVIAITHVTANISLCDKLVVLGEGGKLCFYGSSAEALQFFGVNDFVEIYEKVSQNPDGWRLRYTTYELSPLYVKRDEASSPEVPSYNAGHGLLEDNKKSAIRQFSVLSRRYLALILADPKRLLMLILQAPLLGLLLSAVSYGVDDNGLNKVYRYSGETKAFLFSLACAAFWLGMLNAVQEICKERDIFRRERMAVLKLAPYLMSKLAVLGAFCLFQSYMLVMVCMMYLGKFPTNDLGVYPFGGMFFTTFLCAFSASALGLAISAASPNADRAMTLAPVVLMPQILFSGVAFELEGVTTFISNLIHCKWAIQGYAVLCDLNEYGDNADSTSVTYLDAAFDHTWNNLGWSWGAMVIITLVCLTICLLGTHDIAHPKRRE